MLSKTTLQHLSWSHTRALMIASSQKTDLVDRLWKIKSTYMYKKHVHQDVTLMEGSENPRSQMIPLRPTHFIKKLTNTSTGTSTEASSNPADITPSLTKFKCNVCGRVYKNRKFLNMHFRKSSNCQVRTASLPGFLPPEPEVSPKPESGARPFVCANCNKSFKTANELGKHRKRSVRCISSRGDQEEEYRLTMEIIKALGAEGPFVFPESKVRKREERENVLWWQKDLES